MFRPEAAPLRRHAFAARRNKVLFELAESAFTIHIAIYNDKESVIAQQVWTKSQAAVDIAKRFQARN